VIDAMVMFIISILAAICMTLVLGVVLGYGIYKVIMFAYLLYSKGVVDGNSLVLGVALIVFSLMFLTGAGKVSVDEDGGVR